MSDLSILAQHSQTQAANTDLPDVERALWWQIAEEVANYLEARSIIAAATEPGLFDA